MLIHITPRIYVPGHLNLNCTLVDVAIPEFSLILRSNKEITVRRPYANKQLHVACRNIGRKAVEGLFISTSKKLNSLTVITRWSLNAELVLIHEVDYDFLDHEFDAFSDKMMVWDRLDRNGVSWDTRWPLGFPDDWYAPVNAQPVMDIFPNQKRMFTTDNINSQGIVDFRVQRFHMPSIEPERLVTQTLLSGDRMPIIDHAFYVDADKKCVEDTHLPVS